MSTLTRIVSTWLLAARPHTLSAAVVPVMVGGAVAHTLGPLSVDLFILTLIGALLVQIGANFTDEFADHEATASANKYPAPHKVIARGLLTKGAVKKGALVVFSLATLIGATLIFKSGWELLLLCVFSLAAAYFYSAGPRPLGDIALGEPLVFVMMGPVMVMGTVFVQTLAWEYRAWWFSLPVGTLVTAILVANNLRDAREDAANKRRTLVTVFGERPLRGVYYGLIAVAYLVPLIMATTGAHAYWVLLPWLAAPLALKAIKNIRAQGKRDLQHRGLKLTSAHHAVFGLLLALGLLVSTLFG